jgi:hypothetical protein
MMRNKSGKMNVWNLSSRGVGVLATCLVGIAVVLGPAGLTLSADTWFDDWNDANDVNPPLNWAHSAAFPGLYDASSGDYFLAGLDLQEGIESADNDDEIISAIAASGDESQSFSGQVSVRARARINMEEGQHGNIGVMAFSGPDLAAAPSGYGVLVDDAGGTEIDVFTADSPIGPFLIHFIDGDLGLPPEALPLTDVYVQLDNVVTPDSNGTMSITVWQPGEPQPAEPQMMVDISAFVDDIDGLTVTGEQIMGWLPLEGPAGIVFNEEPNDVEDPKTPEGTGTYFWSMASSIILNNGDVNLDAAINGLDVDPFVDLVVDGTFDPLADMNSDGAINGLDVDPFVAAVVGGGVQQIPEPSTLLLALAALGLAAGWRKWKR